MSAAAGGSTGRLRLALIATAAVAALEVAGGIRAGSLALLSDAAHVTMDVVALAIALAAAVAAKRPATQRQTYGFARYEILAALANGALLTAVTVLVVLEAGRRFAHPETPAGGLMAAVAGIGLAVNLAVGALLLRGARTGQAHGHGHGHGHGVSGPGHEPSLNLRAALLHVAGDALGGAAVVAGGLIIARTGAAWLDPLLSLLVSAIIVAGVVGIVRQATDVLLESAPGHAAVPAVRERITLVDGVVDVHDLHVWTIGSGSHALSAHVVLDDRKLSEAGAILRSIDGALRAEFGIGHVTVQFECESCEPDTTIVCSQSALPRERLSTP
ncbi:MAG: cobalt-zinc-cadmium efflux system protein [Candidatus Eremiobacteraeota bacterium]|nr:cobalt-zinc-cadmium efflux system protein [Candidatus Eremiobacteraeota bacterium]